MKVGVFSPYLKTKGGGERYVLAIASYLSLKGEVDVFGGSRALRNEISARLNLNLGKINFEGKFPHFPQRIFKFSKYDLFFYVADGSFFWPLAKKNIVIFQSPDTLKLSGSLDRFKLLFWQKKLCYSQYVANWLLKRYRVKAEVLLPPIHVSLFKPLKKKNYILSVGRFAALPHDKKQEILITVFKKMCDEGLSKWKLYLAGGVDEEGENFVADLKRMVKDYPVEILPNASFVKLRRLYGEAKIYWHAAGFDEDLGKFPERAEHFGITTVEAMAAGCVPIVFEAGGQAEIVENQKNGFLWQTLKELKERTYNLIKSEKDVKELSKQAQIRSKDFSQEKFYQRIEEIIK